MTCDCNGLIVEYSVKNRFVGTGVLLFCFLGYLQMVPVNGDFCSGSGAKVSKNEAEYSKVNCAKKKAAIHERKILTDRQLFSLKLLSIKQILIQGHPKTHFAGAPAQRKIPGGYPCAGCLPLTFSAWQCPESRNSPVGGGTGCTQTADRRR